MKRIFFMAAVIVLGSCSQNKNYEMGTYGYDLEFLKKNNIDAVELSCNEGQSRLLVVPAFQGRVMTSTAMGLAGKSYGWINHKYIESAKVSPQFNPYGGEERLWIGPEGGPYSWFFKEGDSQIYENWKVPKAIDTECYEIISQDDRSVTFYKDIEIANSSSILFKIGIRRKVDILDQPDISSLLGVELPDGLKIIAYKTENHLFNRSCFRWTEETGMPSVWLLSTFNPTPSTTVFIPYNREYEGRHVNDTYFGKVPPDRLILRNGIVYFKIDGEFRSKIGIPFGSAKDICGSYDSESGVLNIIKYNIPEGNVRYVNSQWGAQENPFDGDVINAYNDGPTETGYVQGPFFEVETSSPGAAIGPGESLTHTQYTIHIQGERELLSEISTQIFGVDLNIVSRMFNHH